MAANLIKFPMQAQGQESAAEFELRFKTQMRRAFFDVIQSTMEDDAKKDKAHEWLIELHKELHDRLCALMPSRKDQYDEFIDNALFAQMLRGGAFHAEQLVSLITYVFEQLKAGAAPDMDNDIDERQKQVMASFKPDASFGSIVAPFLDHSHSIIDEIVKRIMSLSEQPQAS
tara:strand:- start:110 stop:625 length:516 start_codon:yes stop_codon:yes gene_type:complete